MSSVVKVEDLHKSFKKGFIPRRQKVLKGVSFTVAPGMVTGFLGANGAGKTTTMKSILGLVFPDSGQVTFFGGHPISPDVKRRIGFFPEHPYFYNYLTGMEFLRFYGELSTNLKQADLKQRIELLLKKIDLLHAKDKKLKNYSKGMLQKIGVAQALVHDPELVILDEPLSGLDPDGRYYLSEIIHETAKSGKAVFFSSHHLLDAERLCENLVILRDGKVIYEGETEKLLLRMGHVSSITYLENEEKKTVTASSLDETQSIVDKLRAKGLKIFAVKQERVSLEDAFVKIALRRPNP